MEFFLQLIVNGIGVGCIYGVIGLGFVIIYKSSDVLNFAQGEFVMIGAFTALYLVKTLNIPFLLAILITLLILALLGIIVQILFLRRMIGESIFAVIMITIGLSEVLRNLIGLIFGSTNYIFPQVLSQEGISIFKDVFMSPIQMWTIFVSLILVIILLLLFNKTRIGLELRTVASDQDVALLMGISVKRALYLSWALSSAVGAIGGILLANMIVVNIYMGYVGLLVFPAVVLGGLNSSKGAVLGGISIGIIEAIAGGYLDTLMGGGVKEVTAFVILIGVLMIKPYGLFGKEEIERV